MNYRPSAPLEALVALLGMLAAAALIASSGLLTRAALALTTLFVALIAVPDLLDLVVRLYRIARPGRSPIDGGSTPAPGDVPKFRASRKRRHVKPWAIVLSVHDLVGDLQRFIEAFDEYRDVVWVIDDRSNDATAELLESAGFRCLRSRINRKKPGALQVLLRMLPSEIETVLVMDPDTRILSERRMLETLIFDFQHSGMAAVTPRIDVRKDGLVASLQRLEYFFSLGIGRKSLGRLAVCSGVAFYRRGDLAEALGDHSLSVYAEDLETSLILLGRGGGCYYDERAHFETEGMTTWRGLFSQRVGWSYGLLRVYVERLADVRRLSARGGFAFYQYAIYLGGLCILAQPLRLLLLGLVGFGFLAAVAELAGLAPSSTGLGGASQFLIFYGVYLLIALLGWAVAVPRGERRALVAMVPLYGIYALFLIVPNTVGYLNWIWLRVAGRRLYNDHYEAEESLRLGRHRLRRVEP